MRWLVRGLMCCVLAAAAWAQTVVVLVDAPAPAPARREFTPVRQVTYLIAFKDSVVRVADQYWVTGETLYYLTPEHERRTALVSSVDRALSVQLNSENNVVFRLPIVVAKVEVKPRIVHRTASVVRKRSSCVCRGSL